MEESLVTFSINSVGEKTGQSYIGSFKVQCIMSPMDIIEADRLYRQLLGENIAWASQQAQNFALALTQLKYRIVQAPAFWENDTTIGGSHIKDYNVIIEIFDQALLAEENYVKENVKKMEIQKKKLVDAIKSKKIKKKESLEETALEEE
jgi:hypothetical protein